VPRDGWLLEVAPPSDAALDAATRALEAVEGIHARLDQLEARLASLHEPRDGCIPLQPAVTP
jgi:hypothetical protein